MLIANKNKFSIFHRYRVYKVNWRKCNADEKVI